MLEDPGNLPETSPYNPRPINASRAAREHFVRTVLPPAIRAQVDNPFGKDANTQSFVSTAAFRHIILPLLQSKFLTQRQLRCLQLTYKPVADLQRLIRTHRDVDYAPLRDYIHQRLPANIIMPTLAKMTTKCLLDFNLDVAAAVRWIGGTHTAAHRDPEEILRRLECCVDHDILVDLRRILIQGTPALCQAEATEENFQAAFAYGNHKSVSQNIPLIKKALLKEASKGYVLVADPLLSFFIPHLHRSPMGIVNVDDPFKKARIIFDASHRPTLWSMAINDWTNSDNEPQIVFPGSFMGHMVWLWNLRISYPREELYPGNDDVSGAFRHNKNNPNLVAMHAYMLLGYLYFATGNPFGGNTCPPNWEPIARARQQYAQYLWHTPDIIQRAKAYLPDILFAPDPTPQEVETFTQATKDSLNNGVFDAMGGRLPPRYFHWVDDNLYADIRKHMLRTIAASIIALYDILGYPSRECPDVVSWDKFSNLFSHTRKATGRQINTQTMTFGLTDTKRNILLTIFQQWLQKKRSDLLEFGVLLGHLNDASQCNRWARTRYFALQNHVNRILRTRFHQVKGSMARRGTALQLENQLPRALLQRLPVLIAKEQATLLWHTKQTFPIPEAVTTELQYLHDYLADTSNEWCMHIGHYIPRDPTWESAGDSSHDGCGALSDDLRYWFSYVWNEEIRHRCRLSHKHKDYIHINELEFVCVILQLVAVITLLNFYPHLLPPNPPQFPILLAWTDNTPTKKWASRLASTSTRSQPLVALLAEILRDSLVGLNSEHVQGILNEEPDLLSRPKLTSPLSSCPIERRDKLLEKIPKLKSYQYFQVDPNFASAIQSALYSGAWQGRQSLPKKLGRFVPVSSTSSNSFIL